MKEKIKNWFWKRKAKQIHITNEAQKEIIKSSIFLNNSYAPYALIEIDNIIKVFHEKYPADVMYQINLNNKFLYIIRDLLIRIEKLERKN